MRKIVIGVFALVGIGIVGAIAFFVYAVILAGKAPADFATRPWIEHKFYTDRLALDLPSELKPTASPNMAASSDGRTENSQRYGMEVVCSVSAAVPGGDLDEAMDRFTKSLRAKPGIATLSETRKEESVLGGRAIATYLVRSQWWRKKDTRILFFKFEDRLYQVHYTSPAGGPVGDAVWNKMKKSIRLARSSAKPVEAMVRDGASGLPPGMRRR